MGFSVRTEAKVDLLVFHFFASYCSNYTEVNYMAAVCHGLSITRPCTRCTATIGDMTNDTRGDMCNMQDTLLARTAVKNLV